MQVQPGATSGRRMNERVHRFNSRTAPACAVVVSGSHCLILAGRDEINPDVLPPAHLFLCGHRIGCENSQRLVFSQSARKLQTNCTILTARIK